MSSPTPKTNRIPLWAWSLTFLVAATLMGMASMVVTLTSWEGDRTSLEEHRALFYAGAVGHISGEHGDYSTQRFLESIASTEPALTEGFVIADGGEDDFGISRGQSYTSHINRERRGKALADLEGPRHRVRADRFSRATSGLKQEPIEGRAAPAFVLERDLVDQQVLWTAQVPVLEDGKVQGSAGVAVKASIPDASLPWTWVMGLILLGWLLATGVLKAAEGKVKSSRHKGLLTWGLMIVFALGLGWVSANHYEDSLSQWTQQRVQDLTTVQEAADYAQVRGPAYDAMMKVADVDFTGAPGYLIPEGEVPKDVSQSLLSGRYRTQRVVLFSSLLAMLLILLAGHRLLASMLLKCRTQPHAYFYVAPSIVGMLLLVFVPFVTGIGLSVFDNDARRYYYVGMANFLEILGGGKNSQVSFYWTLMTTLLWTISNVVLHVGIGLGLAMILKDPLLRFKKVYRVLLIVPWAIPNYITALIWKGMFNKEFGAINQFLGLFQSMLGMEPSGVDWLGGSFATAFTANLVTNTWLGFPFMMVVSLGALQSIPGELYEAADVDGATPWQKFRHITVPLLKPALFPAIILGTIWTFNMFNIIYLVSGGGPNNSTEILITDAYRAFAVLDRHGLAAAYSVIIFLILFLYTVMTNRITKATEGAFE